MHKENADLFVWFFFVALGKLIALYLLANEKKIKKISASAFIL